MVPPAGDGSAAEASRNGSPLRLFVYGSLRMGEENEMARLLHARARYLGEGTIRARLYAIDWYSGAVASDDPADVVHGDVFELDPASPAEMFAALDDYEGDGFARREVEVKMGLDASGETSLPAQAYLFAASVAGLPWIAHGRWPRTAPRDGEFG